MEPLILDIMDFYHVLLVTIFLKCVCMVCKCVQVEVRSQHQMASSVVLHLILRRGQGLTESGTH